MPVYPDNLPTGLIPQVQAGFLASLKNPLPDTPLAGQPVWTQIASTMSLTGATGKMRDLGALPMPYRSRGGSPSVSFTERFKNVDPLSWEIVIGLSRDAIQDNQIDDFMAQVQMAGANFNEHLNMYSFQVLNAGDTTVYGLAYDQESFFSATHIYPGAVPFQNTQNNVYNLALTKDNFKTLFAAMMNLRNDQGQIINISPDLLIGGTGLIDEVAQLTGNPDVAGTTDRDKNPFFGQVKPMIAPWLDTTAWLAVCTRKPQKPLVVVMRENPSLIDVWRDPDAPHGGVTYFKFYARYSVEYANWELAAMGHS
jgi:phage major head subunit gpT-like protein